MEVKGQIVGVRSLLLPGRYQTQDIGFETLMFLPAEPFHTCTSRNFKSLLFYFLSRNTLGIMVQTCNPSTQEALERSANLGCVVNSRLSGTTVRMPGGKKKSS